MSKIGEDLPKILYIMGTARSGSTILEILLSRGCGVFASGELTSLVQDGFIENKQCSCGSSCDSCEVWGRVQKTFKEEYFEEWASVQAKVDWHDGFLRQVLGILSKSDKGKYLKFNQGLIDSIRSITGCEVILDSSKYTGRALALSSVIADMKVICLTRSPAGLLQSFQKPNKDEQKPKSVFATVVYYCATITLLRIASVLLGDKVLHLRYENLIEDPVLSIQKIGEWSSIDFSKTEKKLKSNEEFPVGHLITGNRLRKEGVVKFNSKANNLSTQEGLSSKLALYIMNGWGWILRF